MNGAFTASVLKPTALTGGRKGSGSIFGRSASDPADWPSVAAAWSVVMRTSLSKITQRPE